MTVFELEFITIPLGYQMTIISVEPYLTVNVFDSYVCT